jgi:chemotaxis protein MotB
MKMKINYQLLALLFFAILTSCAPVYRCGDSRPSRTPIDWSKRLRSVVRERDYLCSNLAEKEKEISELKSNVAELQNSVSDLTADYNDAIGRNKELEGMYNDLADQSLSKTDQLSKALKAKSDELANKEKLLTEREKALEEMRMVVSRQDSITRRLNEILRNALLGFSPDELSVEVKNGKVYVSLSDKLLFRSGSAQVEQKGQEALKLVGDVLSKNADIDILIEGHTDNVPIKTSQYKDNWDLSVARATAIVRILVNDFRIAPTRMTASGKGEYFPRADNSTVEGRAKNRRTEIILSPKLDEIMKLLNI